MNILVRCGDNAKNFSMELIVEDPLKVHRSRSVGKKVVAVFFERFGH